MKDSFSFTTDTATLAIFDLQAIKHRKTDTPDWWSIPDDELREMNEGNIAFLGLVDDGIYSVELVDNIENPDVEVCIKSPSGEIFIGAGEDTTGGDLEPDDSEYISGKKIFITPGNYTIFLKKEEGNLLISLVKGQCGSNNFQEPIRFD
ncbi:DUF6386 family protein [Xenorhabdus bovienii]|uniref:DUF6386 family protein n=1 Tax=Xenorhabdus bovienii TaxID=40576 RepID=UPI00237CEB6A|nr:DUF6386 family protein [Xenorhabdus bovienii]MDE1487583.1 DUF6386 family protein [Xenorhabdus bovienii]MDE9478460.1 DUF6386 family protein [Xenorhabdus bovienii]MDE9531343.1 DUF6386 family protein [Xenorhabdus bovienii]